MGEVILRRIGDNTYIEPSSPEKSVEAKIQPPAVIGRGPTLKCPEKKVSRNHATIDWDDDGILITSIHPNPTFVIINGKEKTLSRGQSAVLNNGDRFGLLKEAYWYKVILNSTSDENSVKEDSLLSSNDKDNCDNVIDAETVKLTENGKDLNDDPVENSLKNNTDVIQEEKIEAKNEPEHINSEAVVDSSNSENKKKDVQNDVTEDENIPEVSSSSSNRERVLPNWLTKPKVSKGEEATKASGTSVHGGKKVRTAKPSQPKPKPKHQKLHGFSDDSEEEQSSSKKVGKARKRSPQKQKGSPKKANQYHTLSQDVDAPDSDTEIPTNIKISLTQVSPVTKKTIPKNLNNANKKPNQYHSVSQDVDAPVSDGEIDTETKSREKLQAKKPAAAGNDHHSVSDDDDEPVNHLKSPAKISSNEDQENSRDKEKKKGVKTPRKSCEYGEECYRKNPKHRKEMAHPGDMDYVSDDEMTDADADEDDDRPECEFGLTCYRKNSQHRQSFKHTKKPQPPRNAKRKAKRKGYDDDFDDSENEYDADDPFLNDDSSDDYAPTDSSGGDSDINDGAEEKDTKRMLKEAKKFVKKRRH